MPGDVFHAAAPGEEIIDITKIGISDRAILAIKKSKEREINKLNKN